MDFNFDSTWAECARHSAPYALLMLNVDNFKKFNDCYGHPAGDSCLRTVAGAIETTVVQTNIEGLTKDAFTAHYGGDEFTVVIPDSSQAAYEEIAMRVLAAVRNLHIPHEENEAWGLVTASRWWKSHCGGVGCDGDIVPRCRRGALSRQGKRPQPM
jgi:diguanylate cyclase (GGDEF)-like protein